MKFALRALPDQRLDLSPLTPDRLAGMDTKTVERIPLNTTRAPLCVADVFRLRGSNTARVEIEGGSPRFDNVGGGMNSGEVLLDGDAGLCAGRAMRGGKLEIRGSVGPWAASGLLGGYIAIAGDAGARLGGPLAGERAGMSGGVVVVAGNAAEQAGDRLRRGTIVIEGDVGANPGSRMIAGTVIVCGAAGSLPGYLMRRGTLVLARTVEPLPPTFVPVGGHDLLFFRLLARMLQPVSRRAARLVSGPAERFAGDMAVLGKGEVLITGSAQT